MNGNLKLLSIVCHSVSLEADYLGKEVEMNVHVGQQSGSVTKTHAGKEIVRFLKSYVVENHMQWSHKECL